jgi:cytoskeletal protein CcmA (bactofilin family)
MGQIDNLNQSNISDILRRLRTLETASPLNNAAIGRGGIEVYDQGTINVSDGNLIVNGTATISGILNADGTVTLSGTVAISGPFTVSGNTDITGDLAVTGPTHLNGTTDIAGDTTVTGDLTTNGPLRVTGKADITGDLDVDGKLDINGAATLNNNLTVAAGKKITLGGLTLENTGTSGGQVNFPGGSITASTALGMLINHATVEIAGTVVKISSLPTTTQPANIYADSAGRLYRSTAV